MEISCWFPFPCCALSGPRKIRRKMLPTVWTRSFGRIPRPSVTGWPSMLPLCPGVIGTCMPKGVAMQSGVTMSLGPWPCKRSTIDGSLILWLLGWLFDWVNGFSVILIDWSIEFFMFGLWCFLTGFRPLFLSSDLEWYSGGGGGSDEEIDEEIDLLTVDYSTLRPCMLRSLAWYISHGNGRRRKARRCLEPPPFPFVDESDDYRDFRPRYGLKKRRRHGQ